MPDIRTFDQWPPAARRTFLHAAMAAIVHAVDIDDRRTVIETFPVLLALFATSLSLEVKSSYEHIAELCLLIDQRLGDDSMFQAWFKSVDEGTKA